MKRKFDLLLDGITVRGVIDTQENPTTAKAVLDIMPIEGRPQRWGDEVYVGTPLNLPEENPTEIIDVGTVAYWPAGDAVCVFFGPTPASEGKRPKPASPVNVIGSVQNARELASIDRPSELQFILRE